jgi:hypothetical protein
MKAEDRLTAGGPIGPAAHLRATSTMIVGSAIVVMPAIRIAGTGTVTPPVPAAAVGELVSRAVTTGLGGYMPSNLLVIVIFCLVVIGASFWHLLPAEVREILGPLTAAATAGYPFVQQAVKNRKDRDKKQP